MPVNPGTELETGLSSHQLGQTPEMEDAGAQDAPLDAGTSTHLCWDGNGGRIESSAPSGPGTTVLQGARGTWTYSPDINNPQSTRNIHKCCQIDQAEINKHTGILCVSGSPSLRI